MKKARLKGNLVIANGYVKEAADDLRCADEHCSAPMGFRKESWVGGDLSRRSATFYTLDVKKHADDCREHNIALRLRAGHESIRQAISGTGPIRINLNLGLCTENLKYSFPKRGVAAAQNVDEVLEYIKTIKDEGGDAALERTIFRWRDKPIPYKEFFIGENQDRFHDLFKEISTNPDACRHPYLIRFNPTRKTQENGKQPINGNSIELSRQGGKPLVLLQELQAEKLDNVLRNNDFYIVAVPSIDQRDVAQKMKRWESAIPGKTTFIAIQWGITGSHQVTPVEETKAPPNRPQSARRQPPPKPIE